MAQAAAEGKLDEFLKQEMPDNEYARNLASMMMGMTGMMLNMGTAGNHASRQPQGQEEHPGETPAPAGEPGRKFRTMFARR